MKEDLSYTAAMAELTSIAEAMENETISVDDLSQKVKRAQELIAFCQAKLKTTEGFSQRSPREISARKC